MTNLTHFPKRRQPQLQHDFKKCKLLIFIGRKGENSAAKSDKNTEPGACAKWFGKTQPFADHLHQFKEQHLDFAPAEIHLQSNEEK